MVRTELKSGQREVRIAGDCIDEVTNGSIVKFTRGEVKRG
jgi:hypothetical protein